jgi:hypothetical protein
MKHLILPIASSPYEGAHQSAIIVNLPVVTVLPVRFNPDVQYIMQVRSFDQEPETIDVDGVPCRINGWVYLDVDPPERS